VGTKTFLLFEPNQHPNLYPKFLHQGMWASPIIPEAPDFDKYPDFARAEGYECHLRPGDILFVPRFWWHCATATSTCVNVNKWAAIRVGEHPWWHQQPAARDLISFGALLTLVTERFEAQDPLLQEFTRPEFEELRQQILEKII